MKKILLALALFAISSAQHLSASDLQAPYFSFVRSEVTNQLTIASNTLPLNKTLIGQLKATLKVIDKNTTNTLAPGVKTLGLVTKGLNKTSISNIFDAELQNVVDIYFDILKSNGSSLSNRLVATYPSGPHTSALNNLNQMIAALNSADTNFNTTLASKSLALALKKFVVTEKLTIKAEAAPAPLATVNATITISGSKTSFKSTLAVAASIVNGIVFINAVQGSTSGTKSLSFGLTGLVAGANTLPIASGGANQYTYVNFSGVGAYTGHSFDSTGSTATVNYNPATKSLSGSFTFNASEQDGIRTAAITGTFFSNTQ